MVLGLGLVLDLSWDFVEEDRCLDLDCFFLHRGTGYYVCIVSHRRNGSEMIYVQPAVSNMENKIKR
jgi:hypothetical protein